MTGTDVLDLPAHPSSPGAARRHVRARFHTLGLAELSESAELLVSELVTNALLHAHSGVRIEVLHDDVRVRVAVHDRSSTRVARRRLSPQATTGRGLMLVEALAADWGAETTEWGKVTWFDLSIAGSSLAAGER
jgi:anti-sigma regulatory factor (Ser/Thr protein kinase)